MVKDFNPWRGLHVPKIVAIVLTISGDLCRDCIRLHCSTVFDVYDYFRFNVFFQMRQVFESTCREMWCDNECSCCSFASRPQHGTHTFFFFLLCFIIGDREFLTGGPAALRHTCCLLGRRMFFLLFFFCLFIDYGVIKVTQDICPCYLSLHVKIKIISEY